MSGQRFVIYVAMLEDAEACRCEVTSISKRFVFQCFPIPPNEVALLRPLKVFC